ncbi:MAG: hypothetical protein JWR69_2216 [Pedosphaera sp.]|nr:hypothetical protein [Pedosphaera sp.]
MKDLMAGIDLHSNNIVVALMDKKGKRVAQQKLPCELAAMVKFLAPFQPRLQNVAVESTYNWYWLVDGLRAAGYPVVLTVPALSARNSSSPVVSMTGRSRIRPNALSLAAVRQRSWAEPCFDSTIVLSMSCQMRVIMPLSLPAM